MPNIKSAKKRVIVNKTKAARNKSRNSALKTAIKKAHTAAETNAADKKEVVTAAIKKVDQAAAKGLFIRTMLLARSPLLQSFSTRRKIANKLLTVLAFAMTVNFFILLFSRFFFLMRHNIRL